MNGIPDTISKFWRAMKSRLMPATSPPIGDVLPTSAPSGVRGPLPPTTSESQRNNVLDAKRDSEKELKKALMSLCFGAALQIAIQCKQAAESEINNFSSLLSLGTAAIFGSLFTSHFIVKKMPNASRMLDKVAFFLAATTFFFAVAAQCPLGIKCAIWAIYVLSLIAIATCNFLLYSGGALTHAPRFPVVEGAAVEAVKEKGASSAGRAGGGNGAVVEVQPKDVFENSKNCSED